MSILVTGCAGFIASNVCRQLLEDGQTVVGVDNFANTYDIRLKNWRMDQLTPNENFSFHKLDICDYEAMRSLFRDNCQDASSAFSAVINLGARAGIRYSVQDPWIYYQVNTMGTLNLLECCREFEVNKFVLSSTSSVNGDDSPRPFREDSSVLRPLSPYAASKVAAETLLYTYNHLHGIDATVLRYFTVYGPAGRPDMATFIFTRSIAEGDPITIFGDGKQERDFTYVDDIARGTIAALKPVGYEIINLGNDRPVAILDLLKMIESALEKDAHFAFAPSHSADMRATWADISKARDVLGWAPQVSIEEGVQRTVQWYQENRDWAREIK